MIILIWLLANAGLLFADKIPYVTIDQRPSVTFFDFGKNDALAAETALSGGTDAIVVTVNKESDFQIMQEYIDIALSVNWERVVGLGIELKEADLLANVTEILVDRGYSGQAPVFIISSNFTVLAQAPFIPVADLSEILINNVTQLVDDLVNMRISVVIASKDQVQRFDPEAQQLEYQTDLFLQLREANIIIDVCCFSNDPLAPEFNGELINEIRHFMKLGGINVLTRKTAIAYAVATEFLLSDEPSRIFNFAVIAELPKLQSFGSTGTVDLGWKSLMNDLNDADVEFVIQLGNVEGVGQNCTEELKEFVSGEFDASFHPFLYSPGEDEWNNCDKTGTSSNQEVQKREDLVVNLFATGNMSLGQNKIPILRQSDLAAIMSQFKDFPQNILWEQNNMLFVYPSVTNVVSAVVQPKPQNEDLLLVKENGGSEIDLVGGTTNTVYDSQQDIGLPKAQLQYEATVAWLELAFNEAIRRQSTGIVLAWHASDVFDYTKHGKGTVFDKLRLLLESLLIKFKKPVLVLQIGGSGFRVDKPLVSSVSGQNMEMLTRVSCAAGQWVNVEANPDATNFNDVFKVTTQYAQIENVLAPAVKTTQQMDTFQRTAETSFSLAVIGGLPFNRPNATWTNLLKDISQAGVSFVVHTGDIKAPNKNCSNAYFEYISKSFSEVNHPLVYVPGDNEWANCNREDNGEWDPMERLEYIRQLFFVDTTSSLGKYPMPITSQASQTINTAQGNLAAGSNDTTGQQTGLPENAVWIREGVVFGSIHMVGQNNNLAERDYDTNDIYADRLLDFNFRNEANKQFVESVFDVAMRDDAVGVILFFNGNPFNSSLSQPENGSGSSAGAGAVIKTGFSEVMDLIQNQTMEFGQPVVLVHSDYQQFEIDQPFNQVNKMNGSEFDYTSSTPRIENLTRVVLPGSGQVWWLEIVVNPSSTEVFTFVPRLVRTNLIDHTPITPIWAADDPDKVCVVNNEEETIYPGQ